VYQQDYLPLTGLDPIVGKFFTQFRLELVKNTHMSFVYSRDDQRSMPVETEILQYFVGDLVLNLVFIKESDDQYYLAYLRAGEKAQHVAGGDLNLMHDDLFSVSFGDYEGITTDKGEPVRVMSRLQHLCQNGEIVRISHRPCYVADSRLSKLPTLLGKMPDLSSVRVLDCPILRGADSSKTQVRLGGVIWMPKMVQELVPFRERAYT
jgi:hypothetical protein